MWQCKVCKADVADDSWEVCWRCSSPRERESKSADGQEEAVMKVAPAASPQCLQCGGTLDYVGPKRTPEETRQWVEWLRGTEELLAQCEQNDAYTCPRCAKREPAGLQCPICRSKRLVNGRVYNDKSGPTLFAPEDLRIRFTINTPAYLYINPESLACLDCGVVLVKTNAKDARECIQKLGSDYLRQAMNLPVEE